MTRKRTNGKTPNGGDYSEVVFLNDAGDSVDETVATKCVIRECKADGTLVNEIIGICNADEER